MLLFSLVQGLRRANYASLRAPKSAWTVRLRRHAMLAAGPTQPRTRASVDPRTIDNKTQARLEVPTARFPNEPMKVQPCPHN